MAATASPPAYVDPAAEDARLYSARSGATVNLKRGVERTAERRGEKRFFSERLYISFNPALAPTRVLPVAPTPLSEENRKAALFFWSKQITDFKTPRSWSPTVGQPGGPDILQLAGVESHSALSCVR